MLAILMCVISVSGLHGLLALDSSECNSGMFRPEVGGGCQPCSSCPEPQIVRETCWGNRDTVCGKFTEFIHFKNSDTIKIVRGDPSTRRDIKEPTEPEVANDNVDEWHTITMVTIGVLLVSAVLFSAFIIVTCLRCRRENKEGIITQIDKDSDFEKAEPDARYPPMPSTSGNNTVTSSVRSSFRSIEQFEIAEETPPN